MDIGIFTYNCLDDPRRVLMKGDVSGKGRVNTGIFTYNGLDDPRGVSMKGDVS